MQYIKVNWLHEFNDEPIWLYSELDNGRNEIRKVEVFPDGRYGYAYDGGTKRTTQLSEKPLPPDREIGRDPQFKVVSITKEEFEGVWATALSDR